MILRLLSPDAGSMHFAGEDIGRLSRQRLRAMRAKLQLVPQNPQTSFNPRLSIGSSIAFNLQSHGWERRGVGARIAELLDRVGLSSAYSSRYPHELSGGQLQRAAIARALSTDPELVVCDEAVSALDKSVQAQVLNLLVELQRDSGVAYLFISHDLTVVEHLSDRVIVMYLGRIVEEGPARELWRNPAHPYTAALLSASPGAEGPRIKLEGDPPSPANPPSGCCFHTRCAIAVNECAIERPRLRETLPSRRVACLRAEPALISTQ
jgi:peptide/nickel transport system ATP-binding protein/oligopeptide transport system ATP-binding protein